MQPGPKIGPGATRRNKNKNMTYSSTLSVGRQKYAGRGQNAVTFKDTSRRLGPISNSVVLVILSCLLGMVYLTQVTKTNAYSYQIDQLQQKKASLQNEKDELQLVSARLQSLNSVKESPEAANLVSVAPSGTIQN
jgi:hypothetical protein